VQSRDLLTERVLGRKLTPYDRSIDTHVSNLRRKLGLALPGLPEIPQHSRHGLCAHRAGRGTRVRSLYLRIFLSFWLAMGPLIAASVGVTTSFRFLKSYRCGAGGIATPRRECTRAKAPRSASRPKDWKD